MFVLLSQGSTLFVGDLRIIFYNSGYFVHDEPGLEVLVVALTAEVAPEVLASLVKVLLGEMVMGIHLAQAEEALVV